MRTVGDRIRDSRLKAGMSQEELAHHLGYKSRSTINKIELGINDISQSKLKRIADALDVSPAYLMGWENEAGEADVGLIQLKTGLPEDEIAEHLRKYQTQNAPTLGNKDERSEMENGIIERFNRLSQEKQQEAENFLNYLLSQQKDTD